MKPKVCSGCEFRKYCSFEVFNGAKISFNRPSQCNYYQEFEKEKEAKEKIRKESQDGSGAIIY